MKHTGLAPSSWTEKDIDRLAEVTPVDQLEVRRALITDEQFLADLFNAEDITETEES